MPEMEGMKATGKIRELGIGHQLSLTVVTVIDANDDMLPAGVILLPNPL